MDCAEILASLCPVACETTVQGGLIWGKGQMRSGQRLHILGVTMDTALGVEDAAYLAGRVLGIAQTPDDTPIIFMIDSSSQRLSRHDELLGLSEYLSHLAKSLRVAEAMGHRSVGILYGHSAAGAFIATALAAGILVALPGANPEVMDLPSVARVTKLPLAVLEEKARTNPVFAPGLEPLARTGAVHQVWDPQRPLDEQLQAVLAVPPGVDSRAEIGQQRGGRPKAYEIVQQVLAEAARYG